MQSFQHAREAQAESQQGLASAEVTAKSVSSKQSHAKNRGRLDVMADVLNCCRSPSSKSHIMLFANVNSIVATRMIENLAETGLIGSIHEENAVVYLATTKDTGFVA